MQITGYGSSDTGKVREHNEDNFVFVPEIGLAVVADGMGGRSRGEIASEIVTRTVLNAINTEEVSRKAGKEIKPADLALTQAVEDANAKIFQAGKTLEGAEGMGSTVVAGWFLDNNVVVAHAGDSRCYRVRDTIELLTDDHTLINEQIKRHLITEEEAHLSENRNVILRAVGVAEKIEVEVKVHSTRENDYYLFCTDGLTGCVDPSEMEAVIRKHADNLRAASHELIQLANHRGGPDNVTALIVKILSVSPTPAQRPVSIKSVWHARRRRKLHLVPMLLSIGVVMLIGAYIVWRLMLEAPHVEDARRLLQRQSYKAAAQEAEGVIKYARNKPLIRLEALLIKGQAEYFGGDRATAAKTFKALAESIMLEGDNLPEPRKNLDVGVLAMIDAAYLKVVQDKIDSLNQPDGSLAKLRKVKFAGIAGLLEETDRQMEQLRAWTPVKSEKMVRDLLNKTVILIEDAQQRYSKEFDILHQDLTALKRSLSDSAIVRDKAGLHQATQVAEELLSQGDLDGARAKIDWVRRNQF